MAARNPARALDQVTQIVRMCDFLEHPGIKTTLEQNVPRPVPPAPGAWGFDIPLWVGLGMVGLWAALDAFADRAGLPKLKCSICDRSSCIRARFDQQVEEQAQTFAELEDLRHLYAHNYAGEADAEYFRFKRHVLLSGPRVPLTCGAQFGGGRLQLGLTDLREYGRAVQIVLERFK